MLIGVPKEIKNHEYRVGLTPSSVRELIHHGHKALVETKAGTGIGFDDAAYKAAGATIAPECRSCLRQGRHDREGEGAAGQGVQDACAPASCCSPICIWRRIPIRPRAC
jgi:hypothetical protein